MEGLLLYKITRLAVEAERPLIIVANPNKSDSSRFGHYDYIANIGDAYAGFHGYSPDELIELYAALKGKLEKQNDNSKQSDNNTADTSSDKA